MVSALRCNPKLNRIPVAAHNRAFISGIVFSITLSRQGQVSGMIAMNLLGAICGGLLEYNSMYFGFQFLYLIAMVCYLLAFVSELISRKKNVGDPLLVSTAMVRKSMS